MQACKRIIDKKKFISEAILNRNFYLSNQYKIYIDKNIDTLGTKNDMKE